MLQLTHCDQFTENRGKKLSGTSCGDQAQFPKARSPENQRVHLRVYLAAKVREQTMALAVPTPMALAVAGSFYGQRLG